MKSFLVIFLAAMSCLCSHVNAQNFFHYDNEAVDWTHWKAPISVTFSRDLTWVLFGNERLEISQCSSAKRFCLATEEFVFALPNLKLAVGAKWRERRTTFEIIEKLEFSKLGVKFNAFRIRSSRSSGRAIEFVFSCERGIVAINDFALDFSSVEHYVLREADGVGKGACTR